MNFKTKSFIVIALMLAFLSCKKEDIGDSDSDIIFIEKCEFAKSNSASRAVGVLYKNEWDQVIIESTSERFLMIVCNMPADFKLDAAEPRNITYSGRVLNIDHVDANATKIELSYLKFMD